MNVLVTAATGFIGGHLVRALRSRGHRIVGTSRSGTGIEGVSECHRLVVSEPWQDLHEIFHDIEVVIHLVHDYCVDQGALTAWYERVKNCASNAGVPRQILISSYSARVDASSRYGRSKFEIEQVFADQTIVRPGLVVGNGGVFGKIARFLSRVRVVPVPGGGGKVPYISIHNLCECLVNIIADERITAGVKEFNLFQHEFITLPEMLRAIAKVIGTRNMFIPLNRSVMLGCVILAENLGLKPSLNSDNLRGFLKNQEPLHVSNIELVQRRVESFPEIVSTLSQELRKHASD